MMPAADTRMPDDYRLRFGGLARLYGEAALTQLYNSHLVVVGLGGVGSWAAEALARTGVGKLTLIDLDDICITNSNRQLLALDSTLGQSKVSVLGARLRAINPGICLDLQQDFLTVNNLADLIPDKAQVVLDAIDSSRVKAALAAYCSYHKKRLVMAGASGGRRDPSRIAQADLGLVQGDALLAKVRNHLHRHHHFAANKGRKFRIDAIYSTEPVHKPQPPESCATASGTRLDCDGGLGSATMVTGTFGFWMAHQAIARLLQSTCTRYP